MGVGGVRVLPAGGRAGSKSRSSNDFNWRVERNLWQEYEYSHGRLGVQIERARAVAADKKARRKIWQSGGDKILWTEVADACGSECQICGVECLRSMRGTKGDCAPEIDHIIPLSRGGRHVRENVQLLCRKCNMKKRDRLPEAMAG